MAWSALAAIEHAASPVAIAPAFDRAGGDTIALGSSPILETQARIEMLGRGSDLKIHELADPSGLAAVVEALTDDGGHIEIMVINAGQIHRRASTPATGYVTGQILAVDGGWLSR
ncbi:Rossmann-fold NAD(P)-binding domain-containing protein [Agrobacterium tumefaciens]|uniref:hypothetical protein n=1 Tax=Agrobacterium tumefaciens TaxID=358 RepID=UPI001178A8A0